MIQRRPTHLLFDFFGTLVDYSPSRTEQGYRRSHTLLHEFGGQLGYERFLEVWSATSARFDQDSALDDREFSMADVTTAFLRAVLPLEPTPEQVDAFVKTYLAEWSAAVRHPAGIDVLLNRSPGQDICPAPSSAGHGFRPATPPEPDAPGSPGRDTIARNLIY